MFAPNHHRLLTNAVESVTSDRTERTKVAESVISIALNGTKAVESGWSRYFGVRCSRKGLPRSMDWMSSTPQDTGGTQQGDGERPQPRGAESSKNGSFQGPKKWGSRGSHKLPGCGFGLRLGTGCPPCFEGRFCYPRSVATARDRVIDAYRLHDLLQSKPRENTRVGASGVVQLGPSDIQS